MFVRPIEFDSAEYQVACELRRRLLREPLGLPLSEADTADDGAQHHFGLFDADERLAGCVIGKPDAEDPGTVRIRQMAIDEPHRGAGFGRQLLSGAEERLAALGFTEAILFARPEATGFYKKCGYATTGAEAQLIGLTHHEMRKPLAGSSTMR